jgi:hypothetical protein
MTLVMLARAHEPQVVADVGELFVISIRLSLEDNRPWAARQLVGLAGTRARLEELHDVLLDRLHQKSSDFDATRGLVVTIAALQQCDEMRVADGAAPGRHPPEP